MKAFPIIRNQIHFCIQTVNNGLKLTWKHSQLDIIIDLEKSPGRKNHPGLINSFEIIGFSWIIFHFEISKIIVIFRTSNEIFDHPKLIHVLMLFPTRDFGRPSLNQKWPFRNTLYLKVDAGKCLILKIQKYQKLFEKVWEFEQMNREDDLFYRLWFSLRGNII